MNPSVSSNKIYPSSPMGLYPFMGLVPVRPNIYVAPPPPSAQEPLFIQDVQKSLYMIGSRPVGELLMQAIEKSALPIVVSYQKSERVMQGSAFEDSEHRARGFITIQFDFHAEVRMLGEDLTLIDSPSFILLAHELIHAYRLAYGIRASTTTCSDPNVHLWTNDEEILTIRGNPPNQPGDITENSIRMEHGFPIRGAHIRPVTIDSTLLYKNGCSDCTIL